MRLLVVCLLFVLCNSQNRRVLQVGLMCARDDPQLISWIGWRRVAAGVGVAWDKIVSEGILPNMDVNITFFYSDCLEAKAVGSVIEMALSNIDIILGPPCTSSAVAAGSVGKSFNVPLIMWGPQYSSLLLDKESYPTVFATSSAAINQARALMRILDRYYWSTVAVVYYTARSALIPRCNLVLDALDQLITDLNSNVSVVYRKRFRSESIDDMRTSIQELSQVSRVTISCFESDRARRSWLLAIAKESVDTDEFVWIQFESRRGGYRDLWKDTSIVPDGNDALALRAAKKVFILDNQPLNSTDQFIADTIAKFKQPPFYCDNCTDIDPTSSQLGELSDAMLLFGKALNISIAAGVPEPTGTQLATITAGMNFSGFTGAVKINKNLTRNPIFLFWGFDKSDTTSAMLRITEDLTIDYTVNTMEVLQQDSVIFSTRGGVVPLNFPTCGYDGSLCPPPVFQQYLGAFIGGAAAIVFLIILVILAIYFVLRTRRLEEERLNQQWTIPLMTLERPQEFNRGQSHRSLQSTVTTSTKMTIDSKKETERHAFFILDKESVVARKHSDRVALGSSQCAELRKMKSLYHDNLCRFVGLCLDGPQLMSIWRFCARGSLKDVIAKSSIQMDWFFKFSLIRDITEGLHFLHNLFGAHGWLSSGTCLVDERWRVQITFYALDFIKQHNTFELADMLWLAPEHIRDPTMPATKEADVYSFSIVCSEILTRKSAWDLENQDYDIEELVYKLKRGGHNCPRPLLDSDEEQNTSLCLLIRDCWDERPEHRPNLEQIRRLLRGLNHNKSSNLMDHVFKVLELYATNLEVEVESRMKELTEEKKKSDILLYRMLPKQVAERLKLGQPVEPETFDCCTLFFSDVVSFTTLASRCTPLQVVNLLNDLYTTFDAIIDNHDVYKVETIGDGYLCVSGLPHRNGNQHAKEIAEMSMGLLRAIKGFRIPHLPKERINIRVGLHTGPVVTGVVGITMPRYCLFGDSVNTASRMESNGKPGRIHISTETMNFLTKVIGGYRTVPRGEVIVKGKGAVSTHWLLTEEDPDTGFDD